MRVLELYSGIGGMHYAFEKSGVPGTIVAAIEISTVANEVYKHNFPSTKLINRNIGSLTVKDIEDMKIDSIFMSPPCQPFTRNGLQKDINDARTISFFHILELIPQLTNLKYILLENVEPFSKSLSRDILTSCLQNSGFNYRECVLSPSDFGVPNSRSRYFLIAKKKNIPFCLSDSTITDVNADLILNILSKSCRFKIFKNKHPEYLTNNCIKLSEIVSNSNDIDTHEYNLPETILNKYIKVLDIRSPDSKGSCCFTSAYGRYAEGTGSVFSPLPSSDVEEKIYELKNNELTKNPDILKSLRLRYFTPGEVSRLMCFPYKFTFPSTINKRQRYKLIGNSINVHIVSLLIILLDYVPDSLKHVV